MQSGHSSATRAQPAAMLVALSTLNAVDRSRWRAALTSAASAGLSSTTRTRTVPAPGRGAALGLVPAERSGAIVTARSVVTVSLIGTGPRVTQVRRQKILIGPIGNLTGPWPARDGALPCRPCDS
jgi:hypothetical protein